MIDETGLAGREASMDVSWPAEDEIAEPDISEVLTFADMYSLWRARDDQRIPVCADPVVREQLALALTAPHNIEQLLNMEEDMASPDESVPRVRTGLRVRLVPDVVFAEHAGSEGLALSRAVLYWLDTPEAMDGADRVTALPHYREAIAQLLPHAAFADPNTADRLCVRLQELLAEAGDPQLVRALLIDPGIGEPYVDRVWQQLQGMAVTELAAATQGTVLKTGETDLMLGQTGTPVAVPWGEAVQAVQDVLVGWAGGVTRSVFSGVRRQAAAFLEAHIPTGYTYVPAELVAVVAEDLEALPELRQRFLTRHNPRESIS